MKKYKVAAAVMLLVVLFGGWFFSDELLAREKAVSQFTPDWDRWRERIPPGRSEFDVSSDPTVPLELRPSILLQTNPSGGKVLIRHNYSDEVYSYEPDTRSIETVAVSNWSANNGEIANCKSQLERGHIQRVETARVETEWSDYSATVDRQKIDAYGRRIVTVEESPNNSKLAVLSVSGWLKGPGIGFVGLGGSDPKIIGQRYLQFFDLTSKSFIGSPISVGSKFNTNNYSICWSMDEKFVLVHNWYREFHIASVSQ